MLPRPKGFVTLLLREDNCHHYREEVFGLWECYLCQRISFLFPREQVSHPLGNINVRFKMRRNCYTGWTWQWAPRTQAHIGFPLPSFPIISGLGGPVTPIPLPLRTGPMDSSGHRHVHTNDPRVFNHRILF